MTRSTKDIDWDGLAAAYTEGSKTLKQLGEEFGVSAGSISRRAQKENWPARARVTKRSRKTGATFEWRLARALDKQIKELEERWEAGEGFTDAASAEKEARTLNVLIRTAEKLKELEVKPKSDRTREEAATQTLDRKRLRETLERRLDKLIAAADARGLSREPFGKRD